MTDENSASGATPNADPQGATPNTPGSGETPETTPTTVEAALKELESYKKALAKANAESKDHRLKAKELDELKTRLENDKLTETEKLQKQLADLQKAHDDAIAQAQTLKISNAVSSHAARLGFADPDDAIRFLDASQIEENASNVETLLKDLLKSKPYLAGTGRASSGGATNPSRSASSANANLSWDIISKMTTEQYNTRRSEIQAWMQKNPPKRF